MILTSGVGELCSGGLDSLIQRILQGAFRRLTTDRWKVWFQAAYDHLETDDAIEVKLADEMADALSRAEDALVEGHDCDNWLRQLVALHSQNQFLITERRWAEIAETLNIDEMESPFWSDLDLALQAALRGERSSVEDWLQDVEQTMTETWESYQSGSVLDEEVTLESVLCHRFLLQGVELWLEAVAEFQNGLHTKLEPETIKAKAEMGQRYLMLVQLVDLEIADPADQLLAWAREWNKQ